LAKPQEKTKQRWDFPLLVVLVDSSTTYSRSITLFATLVSWAMFVRFNLPNNAIAAFDWMGPEIQSGINQLLVDLAFYKPNLIVCLGATALHLFKVGNVDLKKQWIKVNGRAEPKFRYPTSIDAWRGSLFQRIDGSKCLATFHPAFCLRAWENTELLSNDLRKAAREGRYPELMLPKRYLSIGLTVDEILANLRDLTILGNLLL
jgi:uracil-DNA glycosylase